MSTHDGKLPEGYCHWELESEAYRVGIVGTGPGFRAMLDIIFSEAYREYLPPLALVAVAEPGCEREKLASPRMKGVPVYETLEELLEKHPDVNLLVELIGKRFKVRQILQRLPQHVSLIDHTASFFLCALNNIVKIGTHCRLDLDRQRLLLEAIIDEVNEDILLLDVKGKVADVSKSVSERRGLTKEECLGLFCHQVQTIERGIPFCHPGRDDCPFFATLRSHDRAEAMESRVGPDGRLLYYRVYAYPIFNAADQLSHVLMMRRDITERTRCEKMEQQAQRLDVIAKMSTYLAHEIRNPLFAIAGFANSMLKSKELSDKDRQKAQIIAEESLKLDNILKNLLDFARPAAQAKGVCEVGALVSETVEDVRQATEKGLYEVALAAEQTVSRAACDGELLKQCLSHLARNSIEAMPGGGRIEIGLAMRGGYVAVTVADNGPGMGGDTLDKVFNPFFSTKRGYGLGLPLIKKIVEDCGGKVDMVSHPGQGTTVTLLIPPVLAGARDASGQGETTA